jgi:biopolymer transport protein ExbD
MAYGSFDERAGQPMAEINTTPLVDVMLVLLVIFIITAPLFHQAIHVDLPRARAERLDAASRSIRLAVEGTGGYRLDGQTVRLDGIEARFRELSADDPLLYLYADRATRYERVAEVLAAAHRAGIVRIAFVTQPPR